MLTSLKRLPSIANSFNADGVHALMLPAVLEEDKNRCKCPGGSGLLWVTLAKIAFSSLAGASLGRSVTESWNVSPLESLGSCSVLSCKS